MVELQTIVLAFRRADHRELTGGESFAEVERRGGKSSKGLPAGDQSGTATKGFLGCLLKKTKKLLCNQSCRLALARSGSRDLRPGGAPSPSANSNLEVFDYGASPQSTDHTQRMGRLPYRLKITPKVVGKRGRLWRRAGCVTISRRRLSANHQLTTLQARREMFIPLTPTPPDAGTSRRHSTSSRLRLSSGDEYKRLSSPNEGNRRHIEPRIRPGYVCFL